MSVYALQIMMNGMNLGKSSCPTSTLVCKACTEREQYVEKLGNEVEKQITKPYKSINFDILTSFP